MYRPTKGLYDPLTYIAPRTLGEAFPDMYSPAVEISVPRPTLRRWVYRHRVALLVVATIVLCNAFAALLK